MKKYTLLPILFVLGITFSVAAYAQPTMNFGVVVEFSSFGKSHSIGDVVEIIVIAPSWNFDKNKYEHIGADQKSQITISTSKGTLQQYELVETNTDTGIFTGKFLLTDSTTSGNGPENGKLAASKNDMITISFSNTYWEPFDRISNTKPIGIIESYNNSGGGGCLIATATYGSELAPQVQQLRELRDDTILSTESGTNFMNSFNEIYYSFSPIIADYERENPLFKEIVKLAITPMITSLSILNYVDMDSEAEVLGYGISLILLNVGMYFAIPIIAIMSIRKK